MEDKNKGIDAKRALSDVYSMFTNSGLIQDSETETGYAMTDEGEPLSFTVNDLLVKTDLNRFIPTVVQMIIREALEPNLLIIPNLFTQLNLPMAKQVQIGSIGAMYADEIAEGKYSVLSI